MSSESLNTAGAFSQAKDLKNRILFTVLLLIVYRLGTYVPLAGIDPIALNEIKEIIFRLKNRGIGILITDHNVRETLKIVDKVYIVNEGAIFYEGDPISAVNNEKIKKFYLGSNFTL